jgi:hypothetical protein
LLAEVPVEGITAVVAVVLVDTAQTFLEKHLAVVRLRNHHSPLRHLEPIPSPLGLVAQPPLAHR